MKSRIIGIGIACTAIIITCITILKHIAAKTHHDTVPEDIEDGGVVSNQSGNKAPKVIESNKIVEFNCDFSLISDMEPGELQNNTYRLSAVIKDNVVTGSIKWHDHYGTGNSYSFETDSTFMTKLQKIISKHNLAKHNGYCHVVSGLPDMYGSSLNVEYASGESIYAHDNQDCFLNYEAMNELVSLFTLFIDN